MVAESIMYLLELAAKRNRAKSSTWQHQFIAPNGSTSSKSIEILEFMEMREVHPNHRNRTNLQYPIQLSKNEQRNRNPLKLKKIIEIH